MGKTVRLIHWNAAQAKEKAATLRTLGYQVVSDVPQSQATRRELRASPPDVVVIDLSQAPSRGRDVALAIRQIKATRTVPFVFAEGNAETVTQIQSLLPDATFATWRGIRGALGKALKTRVLASGKPPSVMAGYSGTPLLQKLGIKEGMTVVLSGAPDGFESTLGTIPGNVTLRRDLRAKADLVLWFVTSSAAFESNIKRMAGRTPRGGMWIAWPKKASGVKADVNDRTIRRAGLASGLVDYKVCAIDATWSGLKFAKRKEK